MLSIDRANVQLEPVSKPTATASSPAGGAPAPAPAPMPVMSDAEFRDRVLRVLDDALREMDRRGSR